MILPIREFESEIKACFLKYQSLIIVGETGSGKSTQVPQIIESLSTNALAVTQPRRVAAISLANRVAQECKCKLGTKVGYAVRFEDVSARDLTRIKFVTDGLLLKELVSDSHLSFYSTVILDEAHERTLRTDILFGLLKDLQIKRFNSKNPLKLIVMSATLDPTKFANFFPHSHVLLIPGRTFPVRTFYTVTPQIDYVDSAIIAIFQLHIEKPPGDILVFFTGQEEIDLVKRILEEYSPMVGESSLLVCPIYAALPSSQQMNIFRPAGPSQRKVILATNIAETSITIPGIRYVIDPGYVKMRSVKNSTLEVLSVVPISKASARQRSGRAGREAPGECYRMYTETAFHKLQDETEPEIKRTNLASALLLMKASGCIDIVNFNYLDQPEPESLASALEELVVLEALDSQGNLTRSGKLLAYCPLAPNLGQVLLDASELGCTSPVLSIISMLSVDSIFFVPSDQRELFNRARKAFVHPSGDHLTMLNVFEAYLSRKADSKWCTDHYIDPKSMLQVVEIRNQLLAFCQKHRIHVSENRDHDVILSAFIKGSLSRIALKQADSSYQTAIGSIDASIHPASVLSGLAPSLRPDILLFHEVVQTTKRFMRTISIIPPQIISSRIIQ